MQSPQTPLMITALLLKIKVNNMALTRTEINERSNEKRGIKNKSFKLNIDDIAMIKQSAIDLNMSEARLVVEVISFFKASKSK